MRASLRVGTVPYFVARPLDLGLERERGIELSAAEPARLIERLRAGALDVALVSSIEMFRGEGYGHVGGLAIGGHGFVSSVQVFLRRPLEELGSVALDPASRAAQALARVTLESRAPGTRFTELEFGRDPRTEAESRDLGGWLRIGDAALREYGAAGAPPVFNPSEAWLADTGLAFAFAVWLVRPHVELSRNEVASFAAARERGRAETERIAREASARLDLPLALCRRYLLEECRYELGGELARTLCAFRDAAARLGLCRSDVEPRAIASA